jgi:hypothetical protein
MDILNFISWIRGRRVVNSVNPSTTLLPVALQDERRDDEYLTGAISVQNFATQVAAVIPPGAQGPIGPQGVPGPVGPAGLNWQGAWSALGSYVADDAVGYGGASYFCTNAVGPSVTTPDIDLTHWALLASQGATGPQGPQGIQGPQGPPGAGGGGSIPNGVLYQTLYWSGVQWTPTSTLTNNNGRIGINGTNTVGQALRITQSSPSQPNAGYRAQTVLSGGSVGNNLITPLTNFGYGINPPVSGNPIMDNSIFFNTQQNVVMKFSCGTIVSPNEKLMLFPNGQVVVGNTVPIDTASANLVVNTKSIELEDAGAGIYMRSSNGNRWFVQVSNAGTLTVVPA